NLKYTDVALACYASHEILDLNEGPNRYARYSPCYRQEAGDAGKDTRGIIQVHQFNKLEMYIYTTVEEAAAEHQRLLAWEEEMLAKIEVPYRVIDTAAGDLGPRSEEHTSELQSRFDLVCRLLLE